MDKTHYQKRCKVIADLFMKTYEHYIVCLAEQDSVFEIILHTGKVITIDEKTSWKEIVGEMEDKDKCQ